MNSDLEIQIQPMIDDMEKKFLIVFSTVMEQDMDHILNWVTVKPRLVWSHEKKILAYGKSHLLDLEGKERFTSMDQEIGKIFSSQIDLGPKEFRTEPLAYTGFSFFNELKDNSIWTDIGTARVVLPKYVITQQDGALVLTIQEYTSLTQLLEARNMKIETKDVIKHLYLHINERVTNFIHYLQEIQLEKETKPNEMIEEREYTNYLQWENLLLDSVSKIKDGFIEKVVHARVLKRQYTRILEQIKIIGKLEDKFAGCYIFLMDFGSISFLGASPELLVRKKGEKIETMGLAGTARRGENKKEDQLLAEMLMNSLKERQEHDIVVQSIVKRLENILEAEVQYDKEPHIFKLANVQHLRSTIKAKIDNKSLLSIIEELHPTPAVAGKPRDQALSIIKDKEGERGWYASPIGILRAGNHSIDGEFIVALRSALVRENTIYLFAGAGIVEQSDPKKEWEETKLKFNAILGVLEDE